MTDQQLISKILEIRSDCFSSIKVPRPNRIHLTIDREKIVECAGFLRDHFSFSFISASGIESSSSYEVIYYLLHQESDIKISLRTEAPKDDPFFNTLSGVFAGSDWAEKEIASLYSIAFIGHNERNQRPPDTLEIYESVYDLDVEGMF